MSNFERVLVCGGRHYANKDLVFSVLDKLSPHIVICGGATGADELAMQWAKKNGRICYVYYPDWDRHGRAAGPIRNKQMVQREIPDIVVAFPGGAGTDNMILLAERWGIPVERHLEE